MYIHLRDHRRWLLPEVLAFQAAKRPDALYIETTDGERLTYGAADADARRVAGALAALGVEPGDRVAIMLPNGLDFVRLWLGVGRLGAVLTPLNLALTGSFLEHPLRNSGARVVVVDDVSRHAVEAACQDGQIIVHPAELTNATPWNGALPGASDIACILYTSGTTGPSKGVLMPHAHCYLFGLGTIDSQRLTSDDRYYVAMPLFHVNGLMMQLYATMIAGASAVLRPKFSAGAFVDDLHRYAITATGLLGAAAAFIMAQPPRPDDRGHRLRIIQVAPNPAEHMKQWKQRFGVAEVLSGFGMTEVNIPVYGRMGAARPDTSGLVYDRYFAVEIRDPDTDDPLPDGVVGEIMVRPKTPFGFMAGYHAMPEATVQAWRNFWFHTGDAGVRDADGYFTFVDRIKDCIRRRGENISSFEVEAAMQRLEGVREVAAFAIPSEIAGAEDEVMLAIVPHEGSGLTVDRIVEHAARNLPRFAQPRYVELMEDLPKTPTEKIRKQWLRGRGVGPATVDLAAPTSAVPA
jgi:carnitine-CoA ligase